MYALPPHPCALPQNHIDGGKVINGRPVSVALPCISCQGSTSRTPSLLSATMWRHCGGIQLCSWTSLLLNEANERRYCTTSSGTHVPRTNAPRRQEGSAVSPLNASTDGTVCSVVLTLNCGRSEDRYPLRSRNVEQHRRRIRYRVESCPLRVRL